MNRQLIIRSFVGLSMFLTTASLASAQHGGHGGGHGGYGGGHGGYGGGHGGYGGGHGGYVGGHGGYGGGHGGYGGGHGGYGGGHGAFVGGHSSFGHYGGHLDLGHYGAGHYSLGHTVHYGLGHEDYGPHVDYGHHFYPHFDFYVSPWYGGYGYSSYGYPNYSPGSYSYYSYFDDGPDVSVSAYASQVQPGPTLQLAKPATTSEGESYQQQSEQAFRAGDFNQAARLANHALVETPRDGKLLLLTAQTLFAVGDYRSAAGAIHQAASLLNQDEWGYVVENYRQYYRGNAYVDQMDRLNEYIKNYPDAPDAYFLRGYQHGFLGHQASALRDLNKAFELESRDLLAARLIERFGGTPPTAISPNPSLNPRTSPAVESDGHEGHNHGSPEPASRAPSLPSDDGHNHGNARLPQSRVPPSLPLLDDPNVPLAVSDEPSLNSSLAAESVPEASVLAALSKLSPTDRTAALAQRTCPVTGDVLGADGTPIKLRVDDRDLFVCCQGCVADLKNNPKAYVVKLDK